ncbi:MAG TPA: FtsX-like permease family protein [Dehalococcoidia bacterium]|nr:FtsX-like permease family protein [Dehalococcoidia bacterium]
MNELFGLPMNTLMWFFCISLVLIVAWSILLAVRQPVLFRISARNIPRRFGRSMLIVLGLTLATTIIAAALATGDTVTHTARIDVLKSLGNMDEIISSREESDVEVTGEAAELPYFDEADFATIRDAVGGSPNVDGVMPAIFEAVGVQNLASRQTEPRVLVFGADARYMTGFGTIRIKSGGAFDLATLGPNEVLLNAVAAKELQAAVGDELAVYAAGQQRTERVRAIIDYDGIGTAESGLIMSLSAAQDLLNQPGQIQHVIVSNKGDAESGAHRTDAVIDELAPTLSKLGLAVEPTKREDLDRADLIGATFSTFFVTFGSFSIAAGVMLIFLLFVMLSGERKPEMGIARAVGTERIHLIEMFMLEGLLYDVAAAAVGALFGIAVAYVMVAMLSSVMGEFGIDIRFSVSTRSLVTAYAMGVVLTFIVVTLSAWRVSVLNIVTAIRNLPEPMKKATGRASLIWGGVALIAGVLLTWSGFASNYGVSFYMGVSLLLLAPVPLLRWGGVSDRIAFTLSGVLISVWWLLPWQAMDWLTHDMKLDFNIWIAGGLITVTGVTWVVIYNSDLALGLALSTIGRVRGLAPILKTAISYPLTNRFRTGVTLAMFTLVVFVLVVGGTTTTAFTQAFDDVNLYGGGYDVRATTVSVNPIPDLATAISRSPDLNSGDFEVISTQSLVPVDAKQTSSGRDFGAYALRGVDDSFFDNTTYGLALIADGYASAKDVWQALRTNPRLAVVDGLVVPARDNFSFGQPLPDFQLEGFYREDGHFPPTPIEVRDPVTGETYDLTVIGVLKDVVPAYMIGITTSQRFVEEAFPAQATPTAHLLRLSDGADTAAIAERLESSFLANGMEATVLREELHDLVAVNRTFNYLIQGFVGLGLVVGVAALGVVSARSVVERRQEIGVMRAIGFEQGRVQLSFLIESSMVAVAGIVIGTALGLVIAYNVISDSQRQASWENLKFTVPWVNLLLVYAVVLGAALLTSFIPARQASRVYPAEALRYE